MLLRNIFQFRDLIEVSVDHVSIKRFTIPEGENVKTLGGFFEHDKSLFGLSASDGSIWLIILGKAIKFSENIVTEISGNENQRRFRVREKEATLFNVSYTPEKPSWNFFAEEDEDVDGFLWIHNVLSKPERRAVLLELAASDG